MRSRCKGAIIVVAGSLVAALVATAEQQGGSCSAAGTRTQSPGSTRQTCVDLSEAGPLHGTVDLTCDSEPLSEIVRRLRRDHRLPVRLPDGSAIASLRLSLRLREANAEGALGAIAAAAGHGYRWERDGNGLVLVRVGGVRWADAASPESAEALLLALKAEGLFRPGETVPPRSVPPEVKGLLAEDRAMEFAATLRERLPADLAGQASTPEGLAAGRLPGDALQHAFSLVASALRGLALNAMARGTQDLVHHPLVTGEEPTGLVVRRGPDGGWGLEFTAAGGDRVGIPFSGNRVRQWGPGEAPRGLMPEPR